MKKIFVTLSPFIISYFAAGIYLYVNQRAYLYHPTTNTAHHYPTFFMYDKAVKINVIVLHPGEKNAILYFGGNAESMAQSAAYIAGQFPHHTVYLMDYRGYGLSTGESSESLLYKDALTLYDYAKNRHENIDVGGRSLGTAIATNVAANREVSKLALITPFDSIVNVAQERYPIYPVAYLLEDKFDSASRVKEIKADTFIVIAENDKVIPRERTEKLIEVFKKRDFGKLQVDMIKNRGHGDISSDDRYYKIMQDFIGKG